MPDPATLDLAQMTLGALSGVLVGFTLGLVGGGGSILAVPLMIYLVGVPQPHVAIGTAALAVAANAAAGLANHARAGHVRWPCGLTFAGAGIVGALAGSTLGKSFDGDRLLLLFALLMIVIAVVMLRRRGRTGDPMVRISRENAPRLLGYGLGSGAFSGFFGIGGGFLIVPGIVAATGMPTINAVGTSLVAVTAFGLTTAANYAWSGLVDWQLAGLFIAGGALGSWLGLKGAQRLSEHSGRLDTIFALLVLAVAAYMLYRGAGAIPG
ncbi:MULTISPECIES: sulfite exporter TauE/SafE family protein [unclassified Sphingopyxis]|uniref:sulfite exporter TauE/SafE family protein n=1 Tax=unclassified Sphingopyxis TaxID=2614943 RepID=UPI0024AD3F10|nr:MULTISPECIES: sulfite exporter TauE/SafE family protein [unclassified Sphingopyxis]